MHYAWKFQLSEVTREKANTTEIVFYLLGDIWEIQLQRFIALFKTSNS